MPRQIIRTVEPEILEVRSLQTVAGFAHEIRYREVTRDDQGNAIDIGPEQRDTLSADDGDVTPGQLTALSATLDAAIRNWTRRRYG